MTIAAFLGRLGDCSFALAAEPGPSPLGTELDRTVAARRLFRREQFHSGRRCAIAALGLVRRGVISAIEADRSGVPAWPVGIVGSIAHAPGLCAAAVSSDRSCCGIGIDCEPNRPLAPTAWRVVLTQREETQIVRSLQSRQRPRNWPMLYFCIKEAVYKAQCARDGDLFEFQDVEVSLDSGTHFSARCRTPRGGRLTGAYAVSANHILAIAITQDQRTNRLGHGA